MHKNIKFLVILLLVSCAITAQEQIEVAPPQNIKSIVFKGSAEGDQFPLVKLGDPLFLTFDDLYADEEDYYYTIEHCNYDWTLSSLLKSQYLNGLDDQRLMNYENSVATIQPYTNYRLQLPNNQTRLRISGNYILKIFDGYDKLIFSRRFIVYTDAVNVGVEVKRARDLSKIDKMQRLQFTINYGDFELVNPQQAVKVTLMQNSNFNTVITDIAPQFFSGKQLIYKYDHETSFEGGNEYFWFDTKEIRVASNGVAKIELTNRYNHYLYTNEIRKDNSYTYYPDINGDYILRTLNGVENDVNTEADYSFVRFSLEYDESIGLDQVYVYGKFNNYELTQENKLTFDEETNTLNVPILLKQGFYNYKFVTLNKEGEVDLNSISGSHWQTENNYTVIVYYRNFGELYDSVIGIGSINSRNISN